jgi:hypothetical protein
VHVRRFIVAEIVVRQGQNGVLRRTGSNDPAVAVIGGAYPPRVPAVAVRARRSWSLDLPSYWNFAMRGG